jgi:hypothetical protein
MNDASRTCAASAYVVLCPLAREGSKHADVPFSLAAQMGAYRAPASALQPVELGPNVGLGLSLPPRDSPLDVAPLPIRT